MSDDLTAEVLEVFRDALPQPTERTSAIGRIQRVPLREVWRHEALDFTCWLQENTDVLNETTGLSLQSVNREQSCGAFNVDLVGDEATLGTVIIENQLEKSDHDHLGKLITYVSALDAKAAVWIVAEPRPEHIQAINWLNGTQSTSFYLLKVEAVRIDQSRAAPLLTLITGPSETTSRAGETRRELAGRHQRLNDFWTQLLEIVKRRTRLHANISPGRDYWIGTSAGRSGLVYNYVVRQKSCSVELYIDRGEEGSNKAIYDQLVADQAMIEAAYGSPLKWERLDGKRACRISAQLSVGGLVDEERWPEIQENLVDTMIRFEAAIRGPLSRLSP